MKFCLVAYEPELKMYFSKCLEELDLVHISASGGILVLFIAIAPRGHLQA